MPRARSGGAERYYGASSGGDFCSESISTRIIGRVETKRRVAGVCHQVVFSRETVLVTRTEMAVKVLSQRRDGEVFGCHSPCARGGIYRENYQSFQRSYVVDEVDQPSPGAAFRSREATFPGVFGNHTRDTSILFRYEWFPSTPL